MPHGHTSLVTLYGSASRIMHTMNINIIVKRVDPMLLNDNLEVGEREEDNESLMGGPHQYGHVSYIFFFIQPFKPYHEDIT